MSTPAETSAQAAPRARVQHALGPFAVYVATILLALVCLRQWGSEEPWARLDLFSGSYIALNVLFRILAYFRERGRVQRSRAVSREASGLTFDPRSAFWMRVLNLSLPLVVLDYGHLHLVPALENPALQSVGLGLYLLAELGWVWVDTFLVRQFFGDLEGRSLVTEGPYRRVRHPRYTFLLLGRAGVALIFASVLGWLVAVGWLVLLIRRMPMEEAHLANIFGEEYGAYVRRSSRLLPGVY